MADERIEKQKVQEITDKLEEGLKELFEFALRIFQAIPKDISIQKKNGLRCKRI